MKVHIEQPAVQVDDKLDEELDEELADEDDRLCASRNKASAVAPSPAISAARPARAGPPANMVSSRGPRIEVALVIRLQKMKQRPAAATASSVPKLFVSDHHLRQAGKQNKFTITGDPPFRACWIAATAEVDAAVFFGFVENDITIDNKS